MDSFSNQMELNLTRLGNSLKYLVVKDESTRDIIDRVIELVNEEFPKLENMNQITMTGLDAEMEFMMKQAFHIVRNYFKKVYILNIIYLFIIII